MLLFFNESYELFFSNKLPPLIALNYADELFFDEFERLCGGRYRILSIIERGWQRKYCRNEDLERLKGQFRKRRHDANWAMHLMEEYEERSETLRHLLGTIDQENPADMLDRIRRAAAPLDAMSNMLHLFSSLVGEEFIASLRGKTTDTRTLNSNILYYTQPIKESRFAKISVSAPTEKLDLTDEEQALSDLLRLGAYVKDDVSALLEERRKAVRPLLGKISSRIGCDADDVEYLTIPEMLSADEQNIPGSLISDRKDITVLHYMDRTIRITQGKEAREFLREGDCKEIDTVPHGALDGQVASPGSARGRAVVAATSTQAITEMTPGRILVAPYTAVEYLPAMKLAAGIVTETGGITSHAAIVSRELGIPCVIGVKGATRAIKSGDEILVDGDNGRITIESPVTGH